LAHTVWRESMGTYSSSSLLASSLIVSLTVLGIREANRLVQTKGERPWIQLQEKAQQ
jgi:hypothetical protein